MRKFIEYGIIAIIVATVTLFGLWFMNGGRASAAPCSYPDVTCTAVVTVPKQVAPVTTVPAVTTTTAPGGSLPFTGADIAEMAIIGGTFIIGGGFLYFIAKERQSA